VDTAMMAPCYEDYLEAGVDTCLVAANKNYAMYPPDYGTSCKKHVEPGFTSCWDLMTKVELPEADRSAWCDSPWCFVDGCTCDASDVAGGQSAVLTHTDGRQFHVAWSYMNCGEASDYDAAAEGQETNYDKAAWCEQPCPCVAKPPGLMEASCMESYLPDATECIVAGGRGFTMYPIDYGESCKKHLEPGDASCFDVATSTELSEDDQADYCGQSWCYVDGCTCNVADVAGGPSSTLTLMDGMPAVIAYSYELCGQDGSWDVEGEGQTTDRVDFCHSALTCGHVKDFYGDSGCCGMPDKMVMKPSWR